MSERSNFRSYSEDLAKTPGPARYSATHNEIYLKRNPQYTLQGRTRLPSDKTKKPGPGAHHPEKVSAHKTRAPSFHFGRLFTDGRLFAEDHVTPPIKSLAAKGINILVLGVGNQ